MGDSQVGMDNDIFHFEIFKNFLEILKYFKNTPSLKYFMNFFFKFSL